MRNIKTRDIKTTESITLIEQHTYDKIKKNTAGEMGHAVLKLETGQIEDFAVRLFNVKIRPRALCLFVVLLDYSYTIQEKINRMHNRMWHHNTGLKHCVPKGTPTLSIVTQRRRTRF